MNIGKALRHYGRRSGLNRAEIAEKLQISRQEYRKYEDGKRVPNIDLICGMAQVFGITTDEFLKRRWKSDSTAKIARNNYCTNYALPTGNA